ncbi:hypothetical protein QQP08_014285 [Theobroma cacao]|uniref:Uncharacterized protein LOC18601657 n=2 Tax=Theobroma cacao TaxID=3641 RepID=A0AB32V7D5_THECC|nr:PREDICTED: uncharacterized protein LOC18601657 [Theobroma cacao]EOY03678.1 Hydroxyproline-rich glycoprotein family protein [Theobroma cacao]WRX21798.1 hypothetical protein QQP08_014285 [Theobroma cacao]
MEQVTEKSIQSENVGLENKAPPQNQQIDQNSQDSSNDLKKTCTPDRLKVPKAFKYPERYRSPTDSMMSPVTKGLLARNRKGGASLLPPSINQTKIHELRVQDVGLSQN